MVKKIIVVGGIVLLVGAFFGWKHIAAFLNGREATLNDKAVRFVISDQQSLEEIAEDLVIQKLLSDKDAFLSVAAYKDLAIEKIGKGMYQIEPGTSCRALLNGFTLNAAGNGNAEIEVDVTFNNCQTIQDMCEKVAACLALKSEVLEQYILNGATLEKYDFTVESIPALFLPNSYKMYYDTDAEQFVARMAEEFKSFWNADRMSKLAKVGLKSPSQAVTLASIVYGEQSKNSSEWPIIAGLYLNRLNTGMKLQSDPTFKFCWGDQLKGVQRLTFEHRTKDCPYNTYLYAGLPPGPISLPPTGVVDAVLNRDNNNYLYMCAQANYEGLHNFTKEYSVHAKNATQFQNWLASELAQ
jgi:UPF0755 protein